MPARFIGLGTPTPTLGMALTLGTGAGAVSGRRVLGIEEREEEVEGIKTELGQGSVTAEGAGQERCLSLFTGRAVGVF